jgi:hypothetical protein
MAAPATSTTAAPATSTIVKTAAPAAVTPAVASPVITAALPAGSYTVNAALSIQFEAPPLTLVNTSGLVSCSLVATNGSVITPATSQVSATLVLLQPAMENLAITGQVTIGAGGGSVSVNCGLASFGVLGLVNSATVQTGSTLTADERSTVTAV